MKSDELGRSRNEAGFILLDGLLGLGEQWIKSQPESIDQIIMILESIFNKNMCETKGFTKVS